MEIVDVCSDVYSTKASTSALESDEFPLGNLLTKAGPYMAERFIKPPTEILFRLAQPRHVVAIFLHLKVSRFLVTSAEISVHSATEPTKLAFFGKKEGEPEFLLFLDRNYADRVVGALRLSSVRGDGASSSQPLVRDLRKTWSLRRAQEFTLRLNYCSGMPCLGEIQILALVPASEGAERRRPTPTVVPPPPASTSTSQETPASVPPEFWDPITVELMALPVILPSGKTVDRSTLDRYALEESLLGREAGDPFTGLPFSEARQPRANLGLKAAMDRFWAAHPTLARQAPRSLTTHYDAQGEVPALSTSLQYTGITSQTLESCTPGARKRKLLGEAAAKRAKPTTSRDEESTSSLGVSSSSSSLPSFL